MDKKPTMECPSCKEIEFTHVDTLVGYPEGEKRTTLEYLCDSCGEVDFFDERNNDVQDAIREIGYETLDNISTTEAFTIGWMKAKDTFQER